MIFLDFEVFKHDWFVVLADTDTRSFKEIHNDKDALYDFYMGHQSSIYVGYNIRHYDQHIYKVILYAPDGEDNRMAKELNDWIIVDGKQPYQYCSHLNDYPLIFYDVMPNPPVSLKTLEGFMGSDIRETDVPFDIDRGLTDDECKMVFQYCRHDVEETIKVFMHTQSNFTAMHSIVDMFGLDAKCLGYTEAKITATVLGCRKKDFHDEFDIKIFDCINIQKYAYIVDWYRNAVEDCRREMLETGFNPDDEYTFRNKFYKRKKTFMIAGVPHTVGWGGIHGALEHVHVEGGLYHVDVNNYYPSMLIAHDIVTRSRTNEKYTEVYNTRKALKMKQIAAKTKEERKMYKKMQLPYKKMLNALSGAMKDQYNMAYDPRGNNSMVVCGQLMLIDLIEHLEVIPGFRLVQSNTDGLIIQIPDTDEAFDMMDDICYEWECRCSTTKCEITLECDAISKIYQKDVNNYLWVDLDGGVERIGKYVKELSPIDNDLPIVNEAIVNALVYGKPISDTINGCDELMMFQKIVKLSKEYDWVEHEEGKQIRTTYWTKGKDGKFTIHHDEVYDGNVKIPYKAFRVFASKDDKDGSLLKCKHQGKFIYTARNDNSKMYVDAKKDKFADTPDRCFLWNDSVVGIKCPAKLDKQWYIDLAEKRLKTFGV